MPAIPLIGLGVSAYSAYNQSKNASRQAKMQEQMMGNQTALAREMSGFARGQFSAAQPAMAKAMDYYRTLASGTRGAIDAKLAPERAAMNETYKGAEMGITSRLAPGATRDRQIAELYRQRAGQQGLMPFMARQQAVGSMADLAGNMTGYGLDAQRGAASALTGASTTGMNAARLSSDAGQQQAQMIANMVKMAQGGYDWWKRSRGGANGMPGMPGGMAGPF